MKKRIGLLVIFTVILSLISACTAKAGDTAYKAGTYEGKAQGHNGDNKLFNIRQASRKGGGFRG